MTADEELDAILAALGGDLDDAGIDRRTARFTGALRRLRDDPAEATRIDTLAADAPDDRSLAAVVTRALGGDTAGWNEIVDRYAPLVWSVCGRFQLSASDREDVAQNVWLLLIQQLGTLREPAALPGWLATTTRRECLRLVAAARKAGKAGPREISQDEEPRSAAAPGIDEDILNAERNAVLAEAFAALPDRCQQLLGMLLSDPPSSYAQISATLRIPIGSIGPQRARCLERLRRSCALIAGDREKPSPPSGDTGQVPEDSSIT
jgi:RNA polymerase sigma factor (sigma-70 family)